AIHGTRCAETLPCHIVVEPPVEELELVRHHGMMPDAQAMGREWRSTPLHRPSPREMITAEDRMASDQLAGQESSPLTSRVAAASSSASCGVSPTTTNSGGSA